MVYTELGAKVLETQRKDPRTGEKALKYHAGFSKSGGGGRGGEWAHSTFCRTKYTTNYRTSYKYQT